MATSRSLFGTEKLIRTRHAFPAARSLRIVPGMPAFFCDSRSVRSRLPAWPLAVMSLLLPLAACEGFPGFGSQEAIVTPIVIEVPVPQVQPPPEPEEPKPPLPARKPLAALQAKRSQGSNGQGAVNEASPQQPMPDGVPAEGEAPAAEPPPSVVGLNRSALIGQFGRPVAEREAAPARVLEFADGDCQLAAYLYFDTARNDFYVLQYQVNGMTDRNEAADRCLMRIRDAARR